MDPKLQEELLAELKKSNAQIAQLTYYQKVWWLPLRNGILAGLGTVIGATIFVSLFVAIVKPFENLGPIGSQLQRIANDLEHRKQ